MATITQRQDDTEDSTQATGRVQAGSETAQQSMIAKLACDCATKERAAQREFALYTRDKAWEFRTAEQKQMLAAADAAGRHAQVRAWQTEAKNEQLAQRIEDLRTLLDHALPASERTTIESLHFHRDYTAPVIPCELTRLAHAPRREQFLAGIRPPTALEKVLVWDSRYERELRAAEEQYATALRAHEAAENARREKLNSSFAQYYAERGAFREKMAARHEAISAFERGYRAGETEAVVLYNTMVLLRSYYPDGFPQQFQISYSHKARLLAIEYELPPVAIVPTAARYEYNAALDTIEAIERTAVEIEGLFKDVIAAVAVRTVFEVLEADEAKVLDLVVLRGRVGATEGPSRHGEAACLVWVQATQAQCKKLKKAHHNAQRCLALLGGGLSLRPAQLQPIDLVTPPPPTAESPPFVATSKSEAHVAARAMDISISLPPI